MASSQPFANRSPAPRSFRRTWAPIPRFLATIPEPQPFRPQLDGATGTAPLRVGDPHRPGRDEEKDEHPGRVTVCPEEDAHVRRDDEARDLPEAEERADSEAEGLARKDLDTAVDHWRCLRDVCL